MLRLYLTHIIFTFPQKYPDLTAEQLSELKEAFRMFDKDGDGTIDSEELTSVMQVLGMNPTAEELEILLNSVDADRNGVIDLDEFVDVMRGHLHHGPSDGAPTPEDELREAFAIFDKDGNGFISADELKSALLNLGEKMEDHEVRAMIAAADKDGNGQIDYEEFIAMMKE